MVQQNLTLHCTIPDIHNERKNEENIKLSDSTGDGYTLTVQLRAGIGEKTTLHAVRDTRERTQSISGKCHFRVTKKQQTTRNRNEQKSSRS